MMNARTKKTLELVQFVMLKTMDLIRREQSLGRHGKVGNKKEAPKDTLGNRIPALSSPLNHPEEQRSCLSS